MQPEPETMLRFLRRQHYGSLKGAAAELEMSVWTIRRAELGGAVGAETKRRLASAFGLPWNELMRPTLDALSEALA